MICIERLLSAYNLLYWFYYPNHHEKTFSFSHPKKKRPRVADAIKHELKKYIKRERNKALPEDMDFWDFDCRYGADEASCGVIHVSEINKVISEADVEGLDTFFLECWQSLGKELKTWRRKRSWKFLRLSFPLVMKQRRRLFSSYDRPRKTHDQQSLHVSLHWPLKLD